MFSLVCAGRWAGEGTDCWISRAESAETGARANTTASTAATVRRAIFSNMLH